jgi:hypothetical protein
MRVRFGPAGAWLGAMVSGLMAFVGSTAMAQDAARMTERTVSVSASGGAAATPDRAAISTAVMTEAATAREAMSLNNGAMKKLIDGLKALGIEAKDIQTTAVNVQPRYGKPRNDGSSLVNGYQATHQVRIVVREIARLGEVLDQAVTLGANQMGGVSFEVSEAERLKDEARKAAMANARRRAELYAAAAGVGVGPVVAISETAPAPGPRHFQARAAMAEAVPVEAGSIDLTVIVHVTWALK